MKNTTNGLSIGGLVVGIVGLLLSFIPCIGVFGGVLAVLGLILSFIGYRSAKDTGGPTLLAIIGMSISGIAILIAIAWGTLLANFSNTANTPLDVENCDEVLAEMELTITELEVLKGKGDDATMKDLSTMLDATSKFISIQKATTELNCNDDPEFTAKMKDLEQRME